MYSCLSMSLMLYPKKKPMVNIFAPETDELCYLSVQDVKDSIDVRDLTDEEIEILIVQAQNDINLYLSEINPSIGCDWIVKEVETTTNSCSDCSEMNSVLVWSCDEVPLDIKRATMLAIKNLIANANEFAQQATMKLWDVVKETTACWHSLEYYQWSASCIDPCEITDCNVRNLLECYRVSSFKVPLCKTCPCGGGCNSCNKCK